MAVDDSGIRELGRTLLLRTGNGLMKEHDEQEAKNEKRALKLDRAIMTSCHDASKIRRRSGREAAIRELRDTYKLTSWCHRLIVTGSFLERTAAELNSGLDIVCEISEAIHTEPPSTCLDAITDRLGTSQNVKRVQHGLRLVLPVSGEITLLPMVADANCQMHLMDLFHNRWVSWIGLSHSHVIQDFSPITRTVIRFVKTWNGLQEVRLPSFYIGAMAIEAFANDHVLPDHFHWRLWWFFDVMVRSFAARRGHPLAPDRISFEDMIADRDWNRAAQQLDGAERESTNAWFATEVERELKLAQPLLCYLRLIGVG